eukprot:FR742638.1.p1 GENE.FR742638.1~~FR742638.1.p1  ORF type:complete len:157 (+),score=0.31 FR742638.1:241-711(+)
MIIHGFVGAVQRMLTPLCCHYPRGISTTSYDPDHTGAHALTPDLRQFWHTTGFFPQAITLWFKSRFRVTEVGVTVGGTVNKLTVAPQTHGAGASTNVTVVRFSDDSSSNGFESLQSQTVNLEAEDMKCNGLEFRFDGACGQDFLSLHRLIVKGCAA